MDRFFDVLMLVGTVALVTTAVAHPGTAKDITAGGQAYAATLRAAEGMPA